MVMDAHGQVEILRNPKEIVACKFLSYEETARLLGCSERHVFTLRKKGQLPATLIGGSVKFSIDTINEFIRRQTEGGN